MTVKIKRLVIFLHCWWFGHDPDYSGQIFDGDPEAYGWHTQCKRCDLWDIEDRELAEGSRSHKTKRFFIYWLYRRWWPKSCKDCGKRFGKHDNCLPF